MLITVFLMPMKNGLKRRGYKINITFECVLDEILSSISYYAHPLAVKVIMPGFYAGFFHFSNT